MSFVPCPSCGLPRNAQVATSLECPVCGWSPLSQANLATASSPNPTNTAKPSRSAPSKLSDPLSEVADSQSSDLQSDPWGLRLTLTLVLLGSAVIGGILYFQKDDLPKLHGKKNVSVAERKQSADQKGAEGQSAKPQTPVKKEGAEAKADPKEAPKSKDDPESKDAAKPNEDPESKDTPKPKGDPDPKDTPKPKDEGEPNPAEKPKAENPPEGKNPDGPAPKNGDGKNGDGPAPKNGGDGKNPDGPAPKNGGNQDGPNGAGKPAEGQAKGPNPKQPKPKFDEVLDGNARVLSRPDGEYEVEDLAGEEMLTIRGEVKTLKLGQVSGRAQIDTSELNAKEIILTGEIKGEAQLKLHAPNGVIDFRNKLDGASQIEASAPGGKVLFSVKQTKDELGSKIDGSAKVKIEAASAEFRSKIDGGAKVQILVPEGKVHFAEPTNSEQDGSLIGGGATVTILAKEVNFEGRLQGGAKIHVALSKAGKLRFREMTGGASLIYKKFPGSEPTIEKGEIREGGVFEDEE